MKRFRLLFVLFIPLLASATPADTGAVVSAINALGLDLYRTQSAGNGNLLFSPYSIQNALAMTYAGAAGDTRVEMQRVLHYPAGVILSAAKNPERYGQPHPTGFFAALRMTVEDKIRVHQRHPRKFFLICLGSTSAPSAVRA
ncbi:MAG: serpin family protein [Opitutaceae bacterium]|jgi:hypothetical protein